MFEERTQILCSYFVHMAAILKLRQLSNWNRRTVCFERDYQYSSCTHFRFKLDISHSILNIDRPKLNTVQLNWYLRGLLKILLFAFFLLNNIKSTIRLKHCRYSSLDSNNNVIFCSIVRWDSPKLSAFSCACTSSK